MDDMTETPEANDPGVARDPVLMAMTLEEIEAHIIELDLRLKDARRNVALGGKSFRPERDVADAKLKAAKAERSIKFKERRKGKKG